MCRYLSFLNELEILLDIMLIPAQTKCKVYQKTKKLSDFSAGISGSCLSCDNSLKARQRTFLLYTYSMNKSCSFVVVVVVTLKNCTLQLSLSLKKKKHFSHNFSSVSCSLSLLSPVDVISTSETEEAEFSSKKEIHVLMPVWILSKLSRFLSSQFC